MVGTVGAGRRQWFIDRGQEFLKNGMGRQTNRNGVTAGTDNVRNLGFGFQNDREGSGPECIHNLRKNLRDGAGQLLNLIQMVDVENEGVVGWPGFKTINFSDGLDTERQGRDVRHRCGIGAVG